MSSNSATFIRVSARSDPARPSGLEHKTVCVLSGGRSEEREVSLNSGREILAALGEARSEEDGRGPERVRAVEITMDGSWVVDAECLTPGVALERLAEVDLFFLAVHGGEGEDGTLQGLLASHDKQFTGTGVAGSACAMDKVVARHLLAAAGLRVARALTFSASTWNAGSHDLTEQLGGWKTPGWVVKPRTGGSSVGCSVVRATNGLPVAIERAFACEELVLVEELIEGVEVAAGVLHTPDGGLEALPIVEIRPRAGAFFDYQQKYSASGARELCPPERLGPEPCERLRTLALRAHESLGCSGFSRTDFIVPAMGNATGENETGEVTGGKGWGEPVFLETNTLPGMTARSLLPLASGVAGIDFRTLCLWIGGRALA